MPMLLRHYDVIFEENLQKLFNFFIHVSFVGSVTIANGQIEWNNQPMSIYYKWCTV